MKFLELSNDEIIEIIQDWEKEAKEYHEELNRVWLQNENYYLGKQTDIDKIPPDMSNAVINHIFMGVETIIPIITSNVPTFIVEPSEESDLSIKNSYTIQKVLLSLYDTQQIKEKGEILMRHMLLYRYGCWKVYWDEDEDICSVKVVRPRRILIPKTFSYPPFVIEQIDITSDDFIEFFGEESFKNFLKTFGEEDRYSKLYTIEEVWTPEAVIWKKGGVIIDKKPNPYYNFETKSKNYFKNPKIPYIFVSPFKTTNSFIGDTDLIQQTIPIQDIINVAARLIINNARKTGNCQWFIDSSVMSEEEARSKITNAPGLVIWGSGVANPNLMRRDSPPPIPAYIENLKIFSERAFDNIFGVHATTRGERREPETLGGRLLLKEADYGRIDILVREYERAVSELGNWFVQLLKINGGSKKIFKYRDEIGLNFVRISSDMIDKGIKIFVKSGTTLPTDEISRRREAIELWGMGAIDPLTLYERLKFPNSEETLQRFEKWKSGQPLSEKGRLIFSQPSQPTPEEQIEKAMLKMGKGETGQPL